ncbi:hypothetical protein [Terasakiella sp. SH-1]|uniref:hypothetical protein n=1 Tax=Terasakiella sp. SH-1 TaxID=2560057 RepID=UPI001073A924|nr:hypothetical protein [Terasakiella sp. SH-1]
MRRKYLLSFILLNAFVITACSYDIGYFKEIQNEALLAEEIKRWSDAEVMNVRIENNHFSPMVMRFEAGKKYVLKLQNMDERTHSFRAPDFFDSIHFDLLVEEGRYYRMRYITSLVLRPLKVKEYYFIPTKADRYEFDSGNYAFAIPPLHLSFLGPDKINATYGIINVTPEGEFCRLLGKSKGCEQGDKQ